MVVEGGLYGYTREDLCEIIREAAEGFVEFNKAVNGKAMDREVQTSLDLLDTKPAYELDFLGGNLDYKAEAWLHFEGMGYFIRAFSNGYERGIKEAQYHKREMFEDKKIVSISRKGEILSDQKDYEVSDKMRGWVVYIKKSRPAKAKACEDYAPMRKSNAIQETGF